jgi:hypothetical protein
MAAPGVEPTAGEPRVECSRREAAPPDGAPAKSPRMETALAQGALKPAAETTRVERTPEPSSVSA